jgi:hypothetical protein
MARRDYRFGVPRPAYHPDRRDPSPGRATGRPGTRSAVPIDRANWSTPSAVVVVGGAVDSANGRVAPGASHGQLHIGRRLAQQRVARLRTAACASCPAVTPPFPYETCSTVEPHSSAILVLYAMARTGHLRRFRCLIATGGPIVQFTSLDSAGGSGRGSGGRDDRCCRGAVAHHMGGSCRPLGDALARAADGAGMCR